MQWINNLANTLQVQAWQVQNTIDLIADDKTIPFIARYRKEKTGELNEIQIREIFDEYNTQNKLTERKKEILQSLENQQVLTEDLKKAVEHAES
ncbi:MAG TPA: Tex-like N-terminal domain-containing protein, partial [Candidatus Cloacimonadota bacterium]|nr:Tex-like N-terminal domain-containing protein [Candidatus Cloacimonadota bacterium]